jgi:hypothetical protein
MERKGESVEKRIGWYKKNWYIHGKNLVNVPVHFQTVY